jgi:hypothetical protein
MVIQEFLACRRLKTSLKDEDRNRKLVTGMTLKNIIYRKL